MVGEVRDKRENRTMNGTNNYSSDFFFLIFNLRNQIIFSGFNSCRLVALRSFGRAMRAFAYRSANSVNVYGNYSGKFYFYFLYLF